MLPNREWLNPPAHWSETDGVLRVTTAPKSDFWRKTQHAFVHDNGHFYAQPMRGDFQADIEVRGAYQGLYDHAGLMLRVDAENWIKAGVEYFHQRQHASAVVTRDFSDWSIVALDGQPERFWLRIIRKAEAVEIFYALDGEHYQLLRVAYLVPAEEIRIGPMAASPEGNGFSVTFHNFQIQPL